MKDFHELLSNMVSFFDELIDLENRKIDAIAVNDIKKLDEYMKEEQAFTMRLRGLEMKREKLQKQYGFEGMILREIIEETGGEDKEKLQQAYDMLEERMKNVKDAVECANKFIELHLEGISNILESLDKTQKEAKTYDKKGAKKKDGAKEGKFTSKKV